MLQNVSRFLLVGLMLWPSVCALAAGTKEAPSAVPASGRRLFVRGSDQILWLTVAQYEEETSDLANRLYYRESSSDRLRAAALPLQLGPIQMAGVAGQTLHVFFQNRSHYCYTPQRDWRAHQLPNRALPLALAGETAGRLSRLWAVVTADVGAEIEAQSQQQEAASRPDNSEAPAVQSASSSETERPLRIVVYDGTGWQPGIEAPEECPTTDAIWLAVADGRFHLFWTDEGQGTELEYARYESGQWVRGPAIQAPEFIHRAAAGVLNKQVVFAALVKAPDGQNRRCLQWTRAASAGTTDVWSQPPALLDSQGQELVVPTRTAVGLFSDRLALVRMSEKEPPEIAFWLAARGGKPDQPFQQLPAAVGPEGQPTSRGPHELIITIVVAAMLLLVFWRRQESVGLELPPGWQVAGSAKRTLAFVIDATPAALVVLWLWYDPISAFVHEARRANPPEAVEMPDAIMWAWFWFRVLYTCWCTGFEMVLAATPGKRMLGCQVISENLAPASALQLGLRNVTRMIELEPYLKIWPFLFVFFFTRNHQRMGDLLARTLVIERQPLALPGSDHSAQPPEE